MLTSSCLLTLPFASLSITSDHCACRSFYEWSDPATKELYTEASRLGGLDRRNVVVIVEGVSLGVYKAQLERKEVDRLRAAVSNANIYLLLGLFEDKIVLASDKLAR